MLLVILSKGLLVWFIFSKTSTWFLIFSTVFGLFFMFISTLAFVILFLLLTLDFIPSSFSSSLRYDAYHNLRYDVFPFLRFFFFLFLF